MLLLGAPGLLQRQPGICVRASAARSGDHAHLVAAGRARVDDDARVVVVVAEPPVRGDALRGIVASLPAPSAACCRPRPASRRGCCCRRRTPCSSSPMHSSACRPSTRDSGRRSRWSPLPRCWALCRRRPRAARARRRRGRMIVSTDHLSKWYGQVSGLNDVTITIPAGRHRSAWAERRGQVDVHEARHRAAPAERGHRSCVRRTNLGKPVAVPASRFLSRAGRVLRAHDRARLGDGTRRSARHGGRCSRRGRGSDGARCGRPARRRGSENRRLQQGHATAREACAGHRARSAAARARRAAERHGSD